MSKQIYAQLEREGTLGKAGDSKIRRDAFLYLNGDTPDFAQCGSCAMFDPGDESCAIVVGHIVAEGSCGLYAPGEDYDTLVPAHADLSQAEAGYVVRPVRCENCAHYDAGSSECFLYRKLNVALPDQFDLDPKVEPRGCCNAQTPMLTSSKISPGPLLEPDTIKSSDHPGGADLHVKPENAVPVQLRQAYPDSVTRANVWHIAWSMVHDGEYAVTRAEVPLEVLIPTQQVVDWQRVAKHEDALRAGESPEPRQKPPLVLLWDDDYFLLGGHHGCQAACNLGVDRIEIDLMVAPE